MPVAPPSPRFHRRRLEREDAQRITKIILETGEVPPEANGKPISRSADGHDPARLRGLPAIGRNVSGAIRGTNPVDALIAKENGRRRR